MSMAGQIAFITGGAMGIGRAFTETLLAEGAEKVYIADMNEEAGRNTVTELEAQFGSGRCALLVVDVTNSAQFEDAFQRAVTESGHIDLMVNNAGTFNESDWEPVVELNLVACVRGSKLAMEHMNKKNGGRGGRVINTSSGLGLHDLHATPLYCATKSGVRSFTSSMALHPDRELTGVQFASICPTSVKTDFLKKFDERTCFYFHTFKDVLDNMSITPSQVAEGFLKLLRMPHMNGAILKVGESGAEFCKLEYVGLGSDWTPPP
ncbi:15-hydroxyprostaglandin dehydrogenase [NAD(+)] [Plakobranchus ocellatus]|uniref:15-hydroxyprostaglandin dehydrogenase [NAD(+)] n=1 Tax=Plakobranchus ocellatus TaxID=259542 RepID=A0AAV4D6Z5_9GAST|nr:15-hydroxyprostaglandin dehydrogenase [NAD(+)] [Plakobranchus ocellatus]